MRKFITFLLVLSLLVCMGSTALAEGIETETTETVGEVSDTDVTPAESENPESTDVLIFEEMSETLPEDSGDVIDQSSGQTDNAETDIESDEVSTDESETNVAPEDSGTSETVSPESSIAAEQPQADADDASPADVPMAVEAYQVKISWVGMNFTYCEEQKTWDPQSATQTITPAHWESTNTSDGCGKFTVQNSSGGSISVDFSFVVDSSLENAGALVMRFSTNSADDVKKSEKFDNLTLKGLKTGSTGYMYVIPAIGDDFDKTKLQENSPVKLGTITFTVKTQSFTDPTSPEEPGLD